MIIEITYMIAFALLALLIYTVIGFIPGTDETSVLLPISLSLILLGIKETYILSFFISAIITLNLTNAMPTALVGLPGGVMSSPMIESSLKIKALGQSAKLIQKMAAACLISVLISVPTSLLIANLIAPYASYIQPYGSYIFIVGAIFLSLTAKNKLLSLFSIIPLAVLFISLRHLYWGLKILPANTTISVSFFLGITIGPLMITLLKLLNKKEFENLRVNEKNQITVPKSTLIKTISPFEILNKDELKQTSILSLIANFLFILSPVGLVILLGNMTYNKFKNNENRDFITITTMSSITQSTYLSGIIIPLFALGIPLSPVSLGPGAALYQAMPRYDLTNNLHYSLSFNDFILACLIGTLVAGILSYLLILKFAPNITKFVLNKIPHEAVLALFVVFTGLLAYMDAGIINVFAVILIAIVSGSLNEKGVNVGVQFMTLYASPIIIDLLSRI